MFFVEAIVDVNYAALKGELTNINLRWGIYCCRRCVDGKLPLGKAEKCCTHKTGAMLRNDLNNSGNSSGTIIIK